MTTLDQTQRERLAEWTATLAPSWYDTHPDTEYVRGVGTVPDSRDFALGVVAPLIDALSIRAMYRDHDDALLALRPDRENGGILTVFPRARLVEILRAVVEALPPATNAELSSALAVLRKQSPETYLREAVTFALDRRASESPIQDDEPVRLTPAPHARRRSTTAERDDHLRAFLASVPVGEHASGTVFEQYSRAARRSGVTPLGRTTFFRLADLDLGPRVRSARGVVYRVVPPALDPSDFKPTDVLGFTPSKPEGEVRATLLRTLAGRRPTATT